MTTREIDGKKYLEVPDWTSASTMHEINYAYMENLPVSELLWFLDNALQLLKQKAVKLELSAEQ